MAEKELVETINSLTPEQRESVMQFVEFLKSKSRPSAFVAAVDEFVSQHPELLQRLAQ